MTNARYLAAVSNGTPALRYSRDRRGDNWTYTKTDAYRFKTEREAELAAAAEANRNNGVPSVQKAPVPAYKRRHRQASSRMDT